jgi:hypothetical protein
VAFPSHLAFTSLPSLLLYNYNNNTPLLLSAPNRQINRSILLVSLAIFIPLLGSSEAPFAISWPLSLLFTTGQTTFLGFFDTSTETI